MTMCDACDNHNGGQCTSTIQYNYKVRYKERSLTMNKILEEEETLPAKATQKQHLNRLANPCPPFHSS